MKHLQLTPPLLILTMGYPGSGKTFFARQFADQYGLPRVSQDRIRFELFENPQFNEDEADIINRVQDYMLEEIMQSDQTVVCEGTFLSLPERQRLFELAHKNGYRALTVWLQTDLETSAGRSRQRDRRSIDNKFAFPIDKDTFDRMKTQLERPHEKEESVVVSGKHAFKSQCLTVLRKIAAMYSESLLSGKAPFDPTTIKRPRPLNATMRPGQRIIQ